MYWWIVFNIGFVVFLVLHLLTAGKWKRMLLFEENPDLELAKRLKWKARIYQWLWIAFLISVALTINRT